MPLKSDGHQSTMQFTERPNTDTDASQNSQSRKNAIIETFSGLTLFLMKVWKQTCIGSEFLRLVDKISQIQTHLVL